MVESELWYDKEKYTGAWYASFKSGQMPLDGRDITWLANSIREEMYLGVGLYNGFLYALLSAGL